MDWPTFPNLTRFGDELQSRGLTTIAWFVAGAAGAWLLAWWRRRAERRSILRGDARDTVVLQHHVVESETRPDPAEPGRTVRVPVTLRIRTVGQAKLGDVIPNGHLAGIFTQRAHATTARESLISMDGAEGSYLLETLTGFVCDRVAGKPFDHDLYVMAPCCEPAELSHHQPVTILLIAAADLALFADWPACRGVRVEHGGDGCRILTLMAMAQKFRAEQDHIRQLRAAGQRTRYVETMYLLDLALDKRSAAIPTKPVPWGRFEAVLKAFGLE